MIRLLTLLRSESIEQQRHAQRNSREARSIIAPVRAG
jgi:hypothetical protein